MANNDAARALQTGLTSLGDQIFQAILLKTQLKAQEAEAEKQRAFLAEEAAKRREHELNLQREIAQQQKNLEELRAKLLKSTKAFDVKSATHLQLLNEATAKMQELNLLSAFMQDAFQAYRAGPAEAQAFLKRLQNAEERAAFEKEKLGSDKISAAALAAKTRRGIFDALRRTIAEQGRRPIGQPIGADSDFILETPDQAAGREHAQQVQEAFGGQSLRSLFSKESGERPFDERELLGRLGDNLALTGPASELQPILKAAMNGDPVQLKQAIEDSRFAKSGRGLEVLLDAVRVLRNDLQTNIIAPGDELFGASASQQSLADSAAEGKVRDLLNRLSKAGGLENSPEEISALLDSTKSGGIDPLAPPFSRQRVFYDTARRVDDALAGIQSYLAGRLPTEDRSAQHALVRLSTMFEGGITRKSLSEVRQRLGQEFARRMGEMRNIMRGAVAFTGDQDIGKANQKLVDLITATGLDKSEALQLADRTFAEARLRNLFDSRENLLGVLVSEGVVPDRETASEVFGQFVGTLANMYIEDGMTDLVEKFRPELAETVQNAGKPVDPDAPLSELIGAVKPLPGQSVLRKPSDVLPEEPIQPGQPGQPGQEAPTTQPGTPGASTEELRGQINQGIDAAQARLGKFQDQLLSSQKPAEVSPGATGGPDTQKILDQTARATVAAGALNAGQAAAAGFEAAQSGQASQQQLRQERLKALQAARDRLQASLAELDSRSRLRDIRDPAVAASLHSLRLLQPVDASLAQEGFSVTEQQARERFQKFNQKVAQSVAKITGGAGAPGQPGQPGQLPLQQAAPVVAQAGPAGQAGQNNQQNRRT
ncbi:MAG: hypothetical protein D6681_20230 [Calditrichaeota bacterium]|nr:MAG: hypothetical protein D6681_20230 [Calditrichota bacterium]